MNNKTLIEKIVPLVFSTSYLALFILLTISAANKWNEISQNSFMFAILALSLVAVVYPLIKRERTNLPEKIIVVTCFTLLIIAIIVFASVSDGKYREPVIEISSAVTGGLLALYGIGITIKFNRLEKEKDEIEKAKPNVFPIGEQTWVQLDEKTKIQRDLFVRKDLSDFEEAKKTDEGYYFAPLLLANSDLSMCTLKGIGINDKKFVVLHYDNILLKGSNCCFFIDYKFKTDEIINSVQLVLGDMLGNTYSCYVSFYIDEKKNRKKKPIYVTSVLETVLMDTSNHPMFEKK